MSSPMVVVEDENLSLGWARAIQHVVDNKMEVAPLLLSISGFDAAGNYREVPEIRAELDVLLAASKRQSVHTVANTIFPVELWNPKAGRRQLFERFEFVHPRQKKVHRANKHGNYFKRMVIGPDDAAPINQLDHVIETFTGRKSVRRSVLQVSVFDPRKDHSKSALRGFPCLQHVTFSPTADGLNVNAFYATQYMFERAYGNYVGLCNLGRFVAHELGLRLNRFTCMIGIATAKEPGVSASKLRPVLELLDASDVKRSLSGEDNDA